MITPGVKVHIEPLGDDRIAFLRPTERGNPYAELVAVDVRNGAVVVSAPEAIYTSPPLRCDEGLDICAGNRGAAPVPVEILYVVAGVALAIAAAVPVIRGKLMPRSSEMGGPAVLPLSAATAVAARFFVVHVLSLALCEAIVILGLLATFITGDTRAVLAAVAVVGMVLCRPRAERMAAMLRAAESSR